ncbi:hypothetical protein EAS62_21805 [Bradyrhizobium zhanjiangense]|uniref:Uncharacterized protein n=1 Tax=Bradyrhizobium zhanjiangense TaxID=1325107 RepID=A0ABY0DJH3_9BRAD|nr:hypothetical protein EAS62_21805 [Bradyrhizobium zhanjiangense]
MSGGAGPLPPPLAGEGWGEGVSKTGQSPSGESPHPRLRRDLSRKRERLICGRIEPPCHSPFAATPHLS